MRSFGSTINNLIDEELTYGVSNYELVWYKNGELVEINTSKLRFHFGGPKLPMGYITKDYIEIETDYMDFYKGDAIRIDIKKDAVSVTVGTYYVDSFEKKVNASYKAYSSLLELEKIGLSKYESEYNEASLRKLVEYYCNPLGLSLVVVRNMNFLADGLEELSIQDLAECVSLTNCCNYSLQGNDFIPVYIQNGISKTYQCKEVVYDNSKSKYEDDAYLDAIKINYTSSSYSDDEYKFESRSEVIAPYATENNMLELNYKLIPAPGEVLRFHDEFSEIITEDKVLLNDYTVSFLGDPRVQIGDVISFESEDGTVCTFRVGELVWEWDGGLKCIASTGSASINQTSSGGFTSVQQMANAIASMSNALMTVRYNAVYANELYAKVAELGFASVKELSAEVAKMGLMTVEEADIKYMTVQSADLKYASITSLEGVVAKFSELESHAITTENIEAKMADMDYLKADEADIRYMTIQSADLKYASIDLSNIESGTITDAMIANGAIGTAHIADGSITDAKIVGLTANKITAGVLDAATIEVVNLNAANITVGTINGQQIASGAVSLDNLASDVTDKMASTEEEVAQAFEEAKKAMLDSSIAINRISAWSYDEERIYINGAAIYTGTIVADKIATGAVTATKIEAGAIGTDKLAANAVTAAKIATGTITATQIAASTITGAKIASETITATNIASSAITTDKLVASAVTAAKIATGAITADKLAASAVTAAKIAAGAITADKLAANAVTAAKIAAGAITADKLSVTDLSSITSDIGSITAGRLTISSSDYLDAIVTVTFGSDTSELSASRLSIKEVSNDNSELWAQYTSCSVSANFYPEGGGSSASYSLAIGGTAYGRGEVVLSLQDSTGTTQIQPNWIYTTGKINCADVITASGVSLNTLAVHKLVIFGAIGNSACAVTLPNGNYYDVTNIMTSKGFTSRDSAYFTKAADGSIKVIKAGYYEIVFAGLYTTMASDLNGRVKRISIAKRTSAESATSYTNTVSISHAERCTTWENQKISWLHYLAAGERISFLVQCEGATSSLVATFAYMGGYIRYLGS